MSDKHYYKYKDLNLYWAPQREKKKLFESLQRTGKDIVTSRTIKNWASKILQLRQEAQNLEQKLKKRCPHPAEDQYSEHINTSTCEWNDYWSEFYYCGLCKTKLHEKEH